MADFRFYDNLDDPDDGDGENVSSFLNQGRDSVLIAIDCCNEMFQVPEDEELSYFGKTCEAVKDLLRNKIICSEKDPQGVVFFGTEKSKNPNEFNHIFEVQELDSPSASRIEEMQKYQDATLDDIKNYFGQSDKHLISELLWSCSSIFSRPAMTLASTTLIIFTWDDDPHNGDKNAQLRARTKAKDLMEQGTVIQVLSFNPNFNYDKFYKDIVSESDDTDVTLVQNPVDSIKNLCEFLLRKCSKQRNLASVPFQLFDGMELSVGVYTVARRTAKGKSINFDSRYNKEVQLKRNFVEKDTAEVLMPGDIKYFQKWGGRNIAFDYEEKQDMRKFFGAGMKLLGFKPKDKAIKAHYHVRPSQFIYPNEKSVKGSTTMFSALLNKCIERNVVPVCSIAPRANVTPRVVALLPQPQIIDEDTNEQAQSPGFYLIYLPFSEDIRNFDHKVSVEPKEEAVDSAEKMIRKLKFKYHPSSFDNPALQTHYRSLEAMALDKEEPDEVIDLTLPDCERISRKAGDLITQFKGLVFPDGYDPKKKPTKSAAASKRKASDQNGGPASKQTHKVEDIKDLIETGRLAKLTVPELQVICKSNGITATGRKKDLMDAIENYFK